MSEVMTAATLRDEILSAGRSLRAAVAAYRQHSAHFIRTQHEYKLNWDRAFLAADGTEQTRKSTANVETAELCLAYEQALEDKRAAKIEMESWQAIVSGYQSISATAREEMKLSR